MPQCLALARHAYVPIQFRHGLSLKSFRSHSTCAIPKRRFDRILIANRGEIALRVMKTARRMAIECIAVYSDADRDAQHVKFADCAYRLGEAPALNSYLCIDKILDVASRSGAQAIHPGYGFLSENAGFAEACQRAGVKFIGPSAQAIRDMGMKNRAKEIMIAAGVPTLDGYNGREQGDAELLEQAKQIGFPVMIKPVCGGGGKGMRISHSVDDFLPLLHSAQSESTKSFNNADMIIERFVERPRHVEVQVFGDQHGNYVHLWERDCSVQRRHQKIIEEAPAPGLSQEVRDSLGKSAVDAARAVEYEGAGTVEFLMDTSDGRFYFMEMNTRLQVEHPVTESITHIDLVEWQLRVARGEQLPKEQRNIYLFGHALEARLYAEAINPDTMDFMPSAGRLEYLSFPTSDKARVDSGVVEGDEVSVHYDPMIAKVIVWGPSRQEAISRLDKALAETEIGGLPNNVEYVRACLNHPEYMDHATLSTKFIENNRRELYEKTVHPEFSMEQLFEGAVAEILLKRGNFFRLNTTHRRLVELNDRTWMEVEVLQGSSPFHYRIRQLPKAKSYQEQSSEERLEGGERVEVRAKDIVNSLSDVSECQVVEFTLEVMGGGKSWRAKAVQLSDSILVYGSSLPPRRWDVPASERDSHGGQDEDSAAGGSTTEARAPIPGMVEKVLVGVGDTVTRGQPLAILNAMKMEFVIKAPCDCVVESVECQVGQQVSKKALLVKFKPVGGEGE